MTRKDCSGYAGIYRNALLNDVIPFWEKNSLDNIDGGYFTCLDRQGKVFDTDKFIWLQGRQVWLFSMLYNLLEPKDKWLEIAAMGANFLLDHGMSEKGDFYFALTRKGAPLVKPYNIFSDCFAAMAFSQYGKASGDAKFKDLSYKTYQNILSRRQTPKGIFDKNTDTRPLMDFALSMILSNLVFELEESLTEHEVKNTVDQCIRDVMGTFLNQRTGLIHEYTSPEGHFIDSFDGRLISPGHGIESMWFMLDIATRRKDKDLINKAIEVILNTLDFAWDQQHGGIYYFLDAKGHPPQQLEWDQKLWWVHLETLVALSKAYACTQNKSLADWFDRVHRYTWDHFPDPEYGEWFGYLNRQGAPHLTLKGGKWKGCFHLPRALFQCWQTFDKLSSQL